MGWGGMLRECSLSLSLSKLLRRERVANKLCLDRYVNFAHGDEPLDVVYGDSLPRLKTIKKKVDPLNRFNQWFNIK